jgi:hypothetical protein
MKKVLFTTGLILASALSAGLSSLYAQTEQQVVVSEYKGKEQKTPLSGVSVTVLNAATSVSDQNGVAALRFRTMHPGDRVSVRRVVKNGYEIFNTQAVEQWNISPNHPFQLILCQSNQLHELRSQYSRVASDSYARQYKAEQARLASEKKKTNMLEEVYQQKLLDLENQYQQQLEDLENYVDQFARIDLSELNAKQQELIDLVKKGEIDKAIQKYESDDYQGQYRKQCEEIAKIDKAQAQLTVAEAQKRSERDKIYQTINRQIATYRLAGGRENFNKVTALLKSVADADTTQLEAVFAYARHALNQHLDEECEKYFNIYIRACQDKPAYLSSAWWMLGQSYLTQHALKEAEVAFDKALTIRQEMAKQEPDRFADALLEVQNSLVNLYLWTGKYDEAYTILQDAIPVCEKLSKEEQQYYLPPLSTLYGYLGISQYAKGETDKALSTIGKAIEVARPLFNNTEESAVPLLLALQRKGQIAYMTSQWNELVEIQKELVAIGETLYKQNPEKQINNLQGYYNNLAEAYLHLQDYNSCQTALTRSEELLKERIAKKPEGQHYAAFNLYDIAVHLYAALGNTEKKNFYLEAAKTAYSKMQPEEQEQNKGLMEALQKM